MINICKNCNGYGLIGNKTCTTCNGFAVAAQIQNKALYWGKRLDHFEIKLGKARRISRAVVNSILAVILLASFLYFGYYVGFIVGVNEIITKVFWTTPHIALLCFWIGVLVLLYVISRGIRMEDQVKRVISREYLNEGAQSPIIPLPVNEVIKKRRRDRLDIFLSFKPATSKAVLDAYQLAQNHLHSELAPAHLVKVLLSNIDIRVLLGRMSINTDSISEPLNRYLETLLPSKPEEEVHISKITFKVFFDAYYDAFVHRRPFVSPIALFAAAVLQDEKIKEIFYDLKVTEDKLRNVVAWVRIGEELHERFSKFRGSARLKPKGAMNRSMTAQATNNLDAVSEDLTVIGRLGYLAPLVGREKEMSEIFRIFEGGRRSVVLVGQSGVGKEIIIEGLAERMVTEEVPAVLQDKRMVRLSISQLTSGVDPTGAQERLLIILNEIARSGNIILVIPDIEQMVGVSIGEGMDLADAFAHELQKGYFLCIGTSVTNNYGKFIEQSSLGRVLEKIFIEEMDENTAIQALESKVGGIEGKQRVFFTYDALEKAVSLSARYMHDRFLPEKAIIVAEETAQSVRAKRGEKQLIFSEDVAVIVSGKSNIPVTQVTTEESTRLLNLEAEMHKRMIGQNEAVKAVASALRRARAELRSEKRPIANFLFLGPTGVGKTELAKTIATTYFGKEEAMIRIDMSEYQNKESLSRLIGVPGEKDGGLLTEAVRKQPFAIVLLDELEKAHPDILNVFLQVMDDGRLTDNQGRTIDFTNAILIATSNAGSQVIQDEVRAGTSTEKIKEKLVNEKLRDYFKPEFLNRFDGVIVFTPLSEDEILQITWLMVGKIQSRLKDRGIKLEVEDQAAEELAKAGFDPVFGARPLRRVVQEKVEDSLANFLLQEKIGRRDTVILRAGGQIEVKKAEQL